VRVNGDAVAPRLGVGRVKIRAASHDIVAAVGRGKGAVARLAVAAAIKQAGERAAGNVQRFVEQHGGLAERVLVAWPISWTIVR